MDFQTYKEMPHVISNVDSENVFSVGFGVELFRLVVVPGKPFGGVRDVDTTVHCTLHWAENSGSGGGTGKTGIEAGTESSGSVGGIFNHEMITVDLCLTFI